LILSLTRAFATAFELAVKYVEITLLPDLQKETGRSGGRSDRLVAAGEGAGGTGV
jgi:hypothetical protein